MVSDGGGGGSKSAQSRGKESRVYSDMQGCSSMQGIDEYFSL
ncbi:hypothetical protein Lalb_Chr18g0050211 [Lupinus albus]|uniref:Uncharacterized protein n=1 Tax=Lupinus albus TaxID=3870 RepID=A0A6A4NXL5_LUPAL|nr:hypothetical protein Lalb_Chr18g0050211 [Lupinus albus]